MRPTCSCCRSGRVRCQDYYCHTIFECKVETPAQGDDSEIGRLGTVLAGGRYNGLFHQLGGPAGVAGMGKQCRCRG